MISKYFQVSQDYLIGKSGDRGLTKWEDDEIVDAVRESLPQQLTGLNVLLKECTAQEQKETFDILVELGHILNIKDASQRAVAMELIQAVFAATTRCIDVCTGSGDDIDPVTRPQQAIDAAMESYAGALQKAFLLANNYICTKRIQNITKFLACERFGKKSRFSRFFPVFGDTF